MNIVGIGMMASVSIVVVAATATRAAEAARPKMGDVLEPLPAGAVRLAGPLEARLVLCIDKRIAAQNVADVIAPFRDRKDKWEWRSEFWGKWITSAEWALRYTGDDALRAKLAQAVRELIATQSPDGYIGAYPDGGHLQNWDIWGRKYTLLGLLGWHALTGEEAALNAACRLADQMLEEVAPGKADPLKDMWGGLAAGSVLEPMVLLYRRTGDARYLQHAERLVTLWGEPGGADLIGKALRRVPVFEMFPGPKAEIKNYGDAGRSKAYEMMSCYEGLIELYRTTGRRECLAAARNVFDNIRDAEITIIGSGSDWERWCNGRSRQTEQWHKGMETCVTVTWVKFAAQLLRATGDARYADEIERALYNALLGAQATDGTWWCHHSPLAGTKERAPEQCDMHQNCCVANGPRGLMLVPQLAVMSAKDGFAVNLYGPQDATAPLASGNRVRIEQQSAYPVDGSVTITVTPERTESFALRLRIPAWSRRTTLAVNGATIKDVQPGDYAEMTREWAPGDKVTLELDMRTRLVHAPGHPEYVALERGPLVLARDRRLGGDVDAPVAIAVDSDGYVATTIDSSVTLPNGWLVCRAPLQGGGTVTMCDFATAGNTWNDTSRYRVWLPTPEAAR